MQTEKIAIAYPTMSYAYALANLAATQTDTAVPVLGGVASNHVALFDGYVVALTGVLSAAITAGTLSFDFSIDGTAQAVDKTLATAATTEYVYKFRIGQYPFSAGDTLGVTYTSNGSLDPTTSDLIAVLYVVYRGEAFR